MVSPPPTSNRVTPTRAPAMPPEERRAALIASTLPLLREHGLAVTTREIAEAAGIAEGTIFRVFPDKESLIDAVIEQAFDPEPVDHALEAIDRDLPLRARLEIAVEILQHRVTTIWQLMSAVGLSKPSRQGPPDQTALAAVFEPDRDHLTRDPLACAQLLRGLTFACSHPALSTDTPLPPSEIVSVLLDGIEEPS